MRRKDVIKKMRELYSSIPVEKKELLKNFLLNINVKNIQRNSIRQDNPEDILKDYSLTTKLYDWDNLSNHITGYLQAYPMKNILIMEWILSYNPN